MTQIDKDFDAPAFELRLSACFLGGEVCRRELRLTAAEADYLRCACPADLRPLGEGWYEIAFQNAGAHGRQRAKI